MSVNVERILEEVRALSPAEREQVLGFLERERTCANSRAVAGTVSTIRGKYAHVPASSEAFWARKTDEIAAEDRRSLK